MLNPEIVEKEIPHCLLSDDSIVFLCFDSPGQKLHLHPQLLDFQAVCLADSIFHPEVLFIFQLYHDVHLLPRAVPNSGILARV